MLIKMKRCYRAHKATQGVMIVTGSMVYTLEEEKREVKVRGETRIPAGTYQIKLRNEGGMTKRYADKFGDMHKGMLWLQNVDNFEWVYIHIGNREDQTDGCILVGLEAANNSLGITIQRSTDAYKLIYPAIASAVLSDNGAFIEIKDECS